MSEKCAKCELPERPYLLLFGVRFNLVDDDANYCECPTPALAPKEDS